MGAFVTVFIRIVQLIHVSFFQTATSVNLVAGLGFNGYDENGKPLWNRYPCVYITKTEVNFDFDIHGR